MGYHTDFDGQFNCTPTLAPEHAAFIKQFCETRRMKRNPKIAIKLADPIREAVGLPIGVDGGNFVGGAGMAGQDRDESILGYNDPPEGQPGLWCQWTSNASGDAIEWDGGEKFYNYVEWLNYLIDRYLEPWGYKLNGQVNWRGEDREDVGVLEVVDNKVSAHHGILTLNRLAEEFEESSFTSRQIDLIKSAVKFASLNAGEDEADQFETDVDSFRNELTELYLTKFNN